MLWYETVKSQKLLPKQREATEEFCKTLNERYVEYIGKKVQVDFIVPTFREGIDTLISSVVFLLGFHMAPYKGQIQPKLTQINKDGTASQRTLNEWGLESYKYISNIKIVE